MDRVQVKDAPAQHLPEPGRYRHFKGSEYELITVARHSETEEWLAVYFAVDEPERIWVRPVEMFAERVNCGGCTQLRFEPAPKSPLKHGTGLWVFWPLRFLREKLSPEEGMAVHHGILSRRR